MKTATYNVNEVNGRLAALLRWLGEDTPDVVCLQELKSPNDRFPRSELERAGYGAVWLSIGVVTGPHIGFQKEPFLLVASG